VTSVLQPTGLNGQAGPGPGVRRPGLTRRRNWFARNPAWPLILVLAGWPLCWALGVGNIIFIPAAIPMAWKLYQDHAKRGRKIRVPPGFGIWVLFFLVVLAGVATLSLQAPQTILSSVGDRFLSWGYRVCDYSGSTIALLYAGNLTEQELPRRKLAWLLGLVGIYAVVGGLAGVADPHFGFTSPIAHLLPANLQQALATSLNPGTAQNMGFLGYSEGRVKAPFTFTNQWGDCTAILLPWLLVAARDGGSRLQKRLAWAVLLIALVPVVISLDRGLWIGMMVSVLYLAVRLATQGKLAVLSVFCGALAVGALLLAARPLGALVSQRLQHGKSDDLRGSLSILALQDAESSPLIGYGDTRHMQGSLNSIAVGKTANCKGCGNVTVGSNGQLQLLLISTGFLGTFLYAGFFAYLMWRYRRDRTPYGMAGELVLLLGFVFFPVYEAAGPPLAFTMLAVALLWRNDMARQQERQEAAPAGPALDALEPGGSRRAITGGLPA
jgi:hypothetical protein